MAQTEIHSSASIAHSPTIFALGERKLRRVSAWLLLFFLLQGELGAVWDREWHAYVGRDQFWTPPHTLIYSCVTGAGLLALAIVLLETFRYRRGVPGVDDTSTVRILGFFHAPLGFSVLGFGALLALISAPLDNYWHELYGIDIALWAPFHMMGVTGGMIGILGMIYIFASETANQRQETQQPHRFLGFSALELGMLLALASFMNFVLTGFLQFPLVTIGTLHISTYPIPLLAGGALCFIGALRVTNKPGAATLVALFLLLHTIIVELFVPWAIRFSVEQQGLRYRIADFIPHFSLSYAILPLIFIISTLIIDGMAYRKAKQGSTLKASFKNSCIIGTIITIPTIILAPIVLYAYSAYAPIFLPEPGIAVPLETLLLAVVFSVVVALIAGIGGTLLGFDFGDVWHWSVR